MKNKPDYCPICGDDSDLVEHDDGRYVVGCQSCPVQTISAVNEQVALRFWNGLPRMPKSFLKGEK